MKKRIISLLLMLCMIVTVVPMPAARAANDAYCSTPKEMAKWLIENAQPWRTEMTLEFSSSMDAFVEDWDNLYSLLYNAGFYKWNMTRNMTTRTITITDIEYMPGLRLAYAHRTGDSSYIKDNPERFALESAQKIVKEARAKTSTTLEMERYLHDWLINNVTYTRGDGMGVTYYDTCVGVFNVLGAECDGYTDAFYLLCSIAGIPVGYQHGDSYDVNIGDYGSHMWNVVCIDGTWVHVDVTWDDRDQTSGNGFGNNYAYFNLGDVWLSQLQHTWRSECVYYPTAYYMDWNVFFYSCAQNGQDGFGCYYETLSDAASYARSMQKKGAREFHFMIDGYHGDWDSFHSTLSNKGLRGQWTAWYTEIDGYTLYDVYIK